jgi:predicted nuclease of restriction endonuclease-like RecB superfamily
MEIGIIKGYRSGLEDNLKIQLSEAKKKYSYESEKISYIQPEKKRSYTPDFILTKKDGNKMYIESKGRWVLEDRKKHELIKNQYPDLDIRFVFSNPNTRINKKSKTTYANICDKFGWKYSKKTIPQEWLDECT